MKTNSVGPILTRLDSFLRPKSIRNMLVQKEGLDFDHILSTNKILLLQLSQGLIGIENSYLLGSLLLSKLHSAILKRQQDAQRNPVFIYLDEFQHFITPSIKDMISGIRKYNVGLTLSHQVEKLCKDNGIDYRIHKDFFDIGLSSLETESTFADFMIIGSQEFYSIFGSSEATMLVEDLLHDSRCPIVLVPEHFKTAESVVLAYDGSDESVFAIKQFIYLFPQSLSKPAFLAFISREDVERVPKQKEINELVKAHFSKVETVKIVSKEKHVFNAWCMDHLNSIVVSGSYSRSGFSMLFKKSFSEEIITHHQLPVFIAHR